MLAMKNCAEAYLEQQSTAVTLRRRSMSSTTLHRAGLLFSSTFDRDELLTKVPGYHCPRPTTTTAPSSPNSIASGGSCTIFACEGLPPESRVPAPGGRHRPNGVRPPSLLRGEPVLTNNIQDIWDRQNPFDQQLIKMINVCNPS